MQTRVVQGSTVLAQSHKTNTWQSLTSTPESDSRARALNPYTFLLFQKLTVTSQISISLIWRWNQNKKYAVKPPRNFKVVRGKCQV